MAYERYIDKKGRLYIVLRRYHAVVELNGHLMSSPTEVEVLDVIKEVTRTLSHGEFEKRVAEKIFTRVTNPEK